jgi:hypothetical protein
MYPADPSPITVEKSGPPTVAPLMEETVRLEPLKAPVIIEEKVPNSATVSVENVLVPLLKFASEERSCEEEMKPADPRPATVLMIALLKKLLVLLVKIAAVETPARF